MSRPIENSLEIIVAWVVSAGAFGVANRHPDIFWRAVQLVVLIQYVLIQKDIVRQLVVLTCGLSRIFLGKLRQISQFLCIRNQIRIVLRSCSTGKRFGNRAVPCNGSLRILIELGRHGNIALGHDERPDAVRQCCQLDGCSSHVVRHHRSTAGDQHTLVGSYLHVNGIASFGTDCGLAHIRTVVLTVELNGATMPVGQLTHTQA